MNLSVALSRIWQKVLSTGAVAEYLQKNPTRIGEVEATGEPLPLKVALAEFAVLKQEIGYRSQAQLVLFGLNITAAGGIGSFAVAGSAGSATGAVERDAVWLILPLLSPVLGMMWLDHHRNIEQIGNYIKSCLWQTIKDVGASSKSKDCRDGYEGYVDDVQQSGSKWFFTALTLTLLSSFVVVPTIAL